jgi:hypothetical protein
MKWAFSPYLEKPWQLWHPKKAQAVRYAKPPIAGPRKDISPFRFHRRGVLLVSNLKDVVKPDNERTTVF